MKFVKSLDFFTKAKEDIESSTGIGGLFSLIGLVCGILFFIIEISSFLSTVHVKEMTINNDSITKKERVNIDFTFLKAPCGLLTLTQEEEGNLPVVDIPLLRERFSPSGESLGRYQPHKEHNYHNSEDEFNDIKAAITAGEGCRIHGNFSIAQVPGNFHIGLKERSGPFRRLPEDLMKKVSLELYINHLSFGMDTNHQTIQKRFGKQENFSPYEGFRLTDMKPSDKANFFVKLVPNYYFNKENSKNGLLAYMFSLSYQTKEIVPLAIFLRDAKVGRVELPSFQVNYEFSPITINHRKKRNSIARFVVDTLAIVGGIFSVMGMLNNYALTKFKELRYK